MVLSIQPFTAVDVTCKWKIDRYRLLKIAKKINNAWNNTDDIGISKDNICENYYLDVITYNAMQNEVVEIQRFSRSSRWFLVGSWISLKPFFLLFLDLSLARALLNVCMSGSRTSALLSRC